MRTSDTTLWDYVVTYGGPSLFMTAVFVVVLPIVYVNFARPRFQRWPSRLAVLLCVWIVAWFVAYGDVLLIARDAKRLCETEAGLKVYRTVEVEGFAGDPDISLWAKKGFKFVEVRGADGTISRFEVAQDSPTKSFVEEFRSQYELVSKTIPKSKYFEEHRKVIQSIKDGEIVGQYTYFRIYPGWLDAPLAGASGATTVVCDGGRPKGAEGLTSSADLVEAVLKPSRDYVGQP